MHPASWHFGPLKAYDGLLALIPVVLAFGAAAALRAGDVIECYEVETLKRSL